ncbi:hypothetical protein [Sciscionella marina]|uniref:hypothetical protein n=1 Tax=Sciscionella marina TaxID=508770 RepID=UPI00035ECA81
MLRTIADEPTSWDSVLPEELLTLPHEPPRYVRASKGSIVDAVEPRIRALLAAFPDMPTSVIMERGGWDRGKTVFFERVQQLRLVYRPSVRKGVEIFRHTLTLNTLIPHLHLRHASHGLHGIINLAE